MVTPFEVTEEVAQNSWNRERRSSSIPLLQNDGKLLTRLCVVFVHNGSQSPNGAAAEEALAVTLWNRSGRMNGFRQYDFGVLAKLLLTVIYWNEGLFHFLLDVKARPRWSLD